MMGRREHKMSGDEEDALTRARHYFRWRPGERKKIKRLSHRKDRARTKINIDRDVDH